MTNVDVFPLMFLIKFLFCNMPVDVVWFLPFHDIMGSKGDHRLKFRILKFYEIFERVASLLRHAMGCLLGNNRVVIL
jgi:hypothetical protein